MRRIDSLPPVVVTPRLVLRRQRPEDATLIRGAIDTSLAHLRVGGLGPSRADFAGGPAQRLAGSATAFDSGDAWLFTIFDATEQQALGAVGLEPAEPALTKLVGPDAVETGYWLRADATGRATLAVIDQEVVHRS